MPKILINNRFVKENNAKVSIFSNAFQRGHGVFETLRTYGDKQLLFPEKHINRLFRSANIAEIKPKYTKKQILDQLIKLKDASKHKLQRIKIILIEDKCIMFSIKLKERPKNPKGVSVVSIKCQRALPEIKSISYLASYLSHEKAVKLKAYDAILISKEEDVFEGAYSNIFWFKNAKLYTRESEVLPGITREIINEKLSFKVHYKNPKLEELKKADEVFLSQSINGIIPVTKIDKSKIGNGNPGPLTKALIQEFQELSSGKK